MVSQENLGSVLTFITPGIIQLLMNNRGITSETAAILLYNSRLYSLLEDEETKLWHLSYPILYDMLEEELTTGKIIFPEEQ
ncbi:MAG: hypothetical protein LBV40_01890 [Methanomicrobiales archaeon]|jgi:hypothetical protein|nr:hypothetical protein [Methanomicrobiales archaeon]